MFNFNDDTSFTYYQECDLLLCLGYLDQLRRVVYYFQQWVDFEIARVVDKFGRLNRKRGFTNASDYVDAAW